MNFLYRCAAILSLLTFSSLAYSATAAQAAAKSKPPGQAHTDFAMQDAYSGMKYDTTVAPVGPAWKQPAVAAPYPALPKWLSLDCTNSTFKFFGQVPAVKSDQTLSFKVTVIDSNDKQYVQRFKLTVRPMVENVSLDGKRRDADAGQTSTANSSTEMTVLESAPIQEGAAKGTGEILNLPPNASLHLQVRTQAEGQDGPPVQM